MRLPGSDKVIVGYDLGKDYAQISCYVTGREEAVSYTHLDVYKRQGSHCPELLGAL